LDESIVDLANCLDEADSLLLWDRESEDLRVNLPDDLRSRQSILDQELSELFPGFDEIALHRMSKHLMNISRLRPTNHLIDRFLRNPLGHLRGCLKSVNPLPYIPLIDFVHSLSHLIATLH